MDTFTAEDAEGELVKLIALVQQDNARVRISSVEGSAVLLSEETYHNLMVTLEFLSTPGLMRGLQIHDQNLSP